MRNPTGLTVMLTLALLAGCDDSERSSEVLSPDDLPPGDITFGLTHTMTREGVRSAVVEADTAVQQRDGRRWDLRGVEIQFFTDTGAESGTLTSRSGEYQPDDGSFIARQDVVLITESNGTSRRLETEELHYDVKTEQIWSDSAWVLDEGGQISRGTSFRSDVHGEQWTAIGLETEGIATDGGEFTF